MDNDIKNMNKRLEEIKEVLKGANLTYNNCYYKDISNHSFLKRHYIKFMRKLMSPVLNPIIEQQIVFNAHVTRTLNEVHEFITDYVNCKGTISNESISAFKPRIIQLLPTLSYGDAVGNEAICIDSLLKREGYDSSICAVNWTNSLDNVCKTYLDIEDISQDDIVIYHFAIGCKILVDYLKKVECKKIMIYHNITPGHFFKNYDLGLMKLVEEGRRELEEVKDLFDYCLTDSEYNKSELIDLGFEQKIDVLPLLIPFDDYDKGLNTNVLEKFYEDDWINILFVGRIAPNKKQEDVIRVFAYYKKNINQKSRLFLVGNYQGMEKYYQYLTDLIHKLGVKDIVFSGHIGFDSILSYYNLADIFLCMSEHEGFCVPLIEAMYFEIPIIAYSSSAIPYVLGDSGVLLDKKDDIKIAKEIQCLVENKEYRSSIIKKQNQQLKQYSYENTSKLLLNYLDSITKKGN